MVGVVTKRMRLQIQAGKKSFLLDGWALPDRHLEGARSRMPSGKLGNSLLANNLGSLRRNWKRLL